MRAITPADCEWLAQLHQASFAKGWSTQEFEGLLTSGTHGWLIEDSAFILIRSAADEAEIITLATDPQCRRKGYATQLLNYAIEQLRSQGCNRLFLEVRHDNQAASALYQSLSFTQTAIRPNYYTLADGTRKDALVMQRQLA